MEVRRRRRKEHNKSKKLRGDGIRFNLGIK